MFEQLIQREQLLRLRVLPQFSAGEEEDKAPRKWHMAPRRKENPSRKLSHVFSAESTVSHHKTGTPMLRGFLARLVPRKHAVMKLFMLSGPHVSQFQPGTVKKPSPMVKTITMAHPPNRKLFCWPLTRIPAVTQFPPP